MDFGPQRIYSVVALSEVCLSVACALKLMTLCHPWMRPYAIKHLTPCHGAGYAQHSGFMTQLSALLTPDRIEPVPREATIAGMTPHHPVKRQRGGIPMRKQTTNFESIPVLDRPPSQKRCGPVTRIAGMKVYCGRCGTNGLINFKTGYCLGCKRKVLDETSPTIYPESLVPWPFLVRGDYEETVRIHAELRFRDYAPAQGRNSPWRDFSTAKALEAY